MHCLSKQVASEGSMSTYKPELGQPLTKREQEVYDLMVQDLSYKEIADKLFISERCVKFHFTSLSRKTGCASRIKLVVCHYKSLLEAA